jgi:phage-related protein
VAVAFVAVKESAIAAGIASFVAMLPVIGVFLLVAAAVGIVIAIIEDLYQAFTGGESVIKEYLWDPMMRWVDDVYKWLGEMGELFLQFWAGIVKKITDAIDLIPNKIKNAIGGIKDYFTGDFGTVKMTREQAFGRAGGATASPVLSTSSNNASVVNRQRQSNSIVINTAAGQSAQEIAKVVEERIGGWWTGQLRSAETAAP